MRKKVGSAARQRAVLSAIDTADTHADTASSSVMSVCVAAAQQPLAHQNPFDTGHSESLLHYCPRPAKSYLITRGPQSLRSDLIALSTDKPVRVLQLYSRTAKLRTTN